MPENAAEAPEAAPPRRLSLDDALAAIDETALAALEEASEKAYAAFARVSFPGAEAHLTDKARMTLGDVHGGIVLARNALATFRDRLVDLRSRASQ